MTQDEIYRKEFENIISFDNLYKGLKDSCRNVRWKSSVISYEMNAIQNTYQLRQDLLNGKYKIQPYQIFQIHEPKERTIVATRIKDRQFQHSLVDNYLYDQLTKSFIRDNCACLRGRGVDDCLHRMTRHLRKYYLKHGNKGYALKCDIHHFFQSIDHDIAKEAVRKRVPNPYILKHVYDIIDSFDVGIGLGSQVSQLIALCILDDLDHYIKERLRIKYYIRYMDDFVLIHEDKEYLNYCLKKIKEKLSSIGSKLNGKTGICKLNQGVSLLQWRFVLSNSGRIYKFANRKKVYKECKKIRKIHPKEANGRIYDGATFYSIKSCLANLKRGDTFYEQRKIVDYYNNIGGVNDG